MKNRATLVWGIVLLVVGLLGIVGVWAYSFSSPTTSAGGEFSSAGQRIYYTGADAAGSIPRTVGGAGMMGLGMMGNLACVNCHGEDGRGGRVGMMLGDVKIPDIRYSALTSLRSEEGTSVPAWTDDDIRRSIRDGIEPNGQPLKAPMPRWKMTDAQLNEVVDYLKELDAR
jgi:cytochrome c oxidase subunit 2